MWQSLPQNAHFVLVWRAYVFGQVHGAPKNPEIESPIMTRKLAFVASLAAILASAACADSTAPKRDCPTGSNPWQCTPK